MDNMTYSAFVVEEVQKNEFQRSIRELSTRDLPAGDILVRVKYSSLNYKDALSASGNRGVTRNYPHTPGIDAAGKIVESSDSQFGVGEQVIVTSYDLGMNTFGGFGQYIRVPSQWVVKLPDDLTLRESMIYGTAGFTAGMSIRRLIHTVTPKQGPILLTGATGGVGSLCGAILSKLGFRVIAVSGKPDALTMLSRFGIADVIERKEFMAQKDRPLLKAQYAGVVDTVGGDILACAIKSTLPAGVITCCGNVASPDLPLNVFPFILRGVTLAGIDSQNCPMPIRTDIWQKLASEWKLDMLEDLCQEISMDQLDSRIDAILKGQLKGRTIIDLEK